MKSHPAPHRSSLPSRRRFLRQGAAAATAATAAGWVWSGQIVPAAVVGRSKDRPAPSNRITLGFIGTGRQATYANLPGFLREPDAQVVAVCDVDAWRMDQARRLVNEHYAKAAPGGGGDGGCAAIADWREVVARADLDAVMISTPDHWHVPMASAAVRAGKDVACEKPLTRSIAEGRHLADLVRRKKRVFRTDSEFRSIRAMHRAAELVRNGRIGQLQRVITGTPTDPLRVETPPPMPVPPELDFELWLGPAPAADYTELRVHPRHDLRGRPGWICLRDYADGMIANWGAHLNDIALWGMDAERTGPVEIEGTGKYPPPGSFWNVILEFEVHFTFASGVRLTCKTDRPYLRFEGSEGWVEVGYPNDFRAHPESLLDWRPGPSDLALPFKTSEKRDFLDAVRSRGATQGDAEVGHRNTSLSHLALAAIERGTRLRWDPRRERVLGDPAAERILAPRPYRAPWKFGA